MTNITTLRIIIIILVSLNVLTLGTVCYQVFYNGFNGNKKGFHKGDWRNSKVEMISKELNFNKDQSAALEKILTEHHDVVKEIMHKIHEVKKEQLALLRDDTLNLKVSDSLSTIITDNERNLNNEILNHFIKIKKLCHPDQIEAYNEMLLNIESFHHNKKHRFGSSGEHPPMK
ncbi:MAG TPA: hypothetical protein VK796_13340 [Cytophaga sp.]|jgi:hypothetical protein|nr:hypothetical protein [Cytophaga sp.]